MPTVYFATNRVLTGADETDPANYGAGIQPPDPGGIIYGTAFVDQVGVAPDPPGVVSQILEVSHGKFSADAAGDLSGAGRNILVFLHGFANSFSNALTYAASNRQWLAEAGGAAEMSVVAWSWPSLGRVADFPDLIGDYRRDQNTARLSGLHLMSFMANLLPILTAARARGYKTYLLAHSMGNLALQSAVENWFLAGNGDAALFDAAFLAAADCAFDCFAPGYALPVPTHLTGLRRLAGRVVIYYSAADQVLHLSDSINGIDRLGQNGPQDRTDAAQFPCPPYAMADAGGYDDYDRNFLTSHQYYRQSPGCRADIAARL